MKIGSDRRKKILRFLIAGAAGIVPFWTTLYVLTEYFSVHYVLSTVAGFVLNTGVYFFLHKFWVFQDQEMQPMHRQMLAYGSVRIFLFSINVLLLYLIVEYVHIRYIFAQIILTGMLGAISFLVFEFLFKPEETLPATRA